MKLGISSCLLGNKVRYDGHGSKDDFIVETLSKYFEFVPYCPEVEILGTPRDTIRLINKNNQLIAQNNKTKENITSSLTDISTKMVDQIADHNLCGYILKSKSPTCGMERVKVYDADSSFSTKSGVGIFAKLLHDRYPYLPLEEEGRLHDEWLRENFLMQVICYADIKEFVKSASSMAELVQYHTDYKYLIYSKSHESYKRLGNIVANHDKKPLNILLQEYEEEFLKAISIKSSVNNTYNVLLHIYGYFKNDLTKDEKEDMLQTLEEFKSKIIPLIVVIKILNIYIKRFDISYLSSQKFLKPYPKEMALRSSLKALK
jgi:uncharacterized protein YbgA (DUF1722 family)/uncharacterized protein YbbK (DUF523 family)